MNYSVPATVSRKSSREERESALRQIYQQVLERQPYAIERKTLEKLEKDFLNDKIGVRRFIKELAHSEVYLNAFYYNFSNMKFLELCFKHFLGRAPLDQSEIRTYCNIMMTEGVARMITTMLDSEEYRKVFGCFTVPYPQQQPLHHTPRAYIESNLLNREHIGQRGRSIPTIYWSQLKLNCEGGTCHPEANEPIEVSLSQEELSQLLKLLQSESSEQGLASLSSQQRKFLMRVLR
jgi:hypothetical protein